MNVIQKQYWGSKRIQSIGVLASKNEKQESENKDNSLRASETMGIRHPAKPLYRNEIDLDATIVSNEDSEEEDYHNNCSKSSNIHSRTMLTQFFIFFETRSSEICEITLIPVK